MAHTPVPVMPPVTRLPAPCPLCQGELSVYVFMRAVDWANAPGGLELRIDSHHHIGPHACCPPEPAEDIMTAALDSIVDAAQKVLNLGDGWKILPAQHSHDLVKALSVTTRDASAVIPLPLAPQVSVVVFAADDMMIGLDQGRTAAQMWADLQQACAQLIADATAWRAGP